MTTRLSKATRSFVPRMAGLTLVNAMIFQEVLADYESQVKHLKQTLQDPNAPTAFADHWDFILKHINYHPIFHVAHELLISLPTNPDVDKAVRNLAQTALQVVQKRASLRHDLMGRIYHRLLTDAKYLGTYYTSVPAATLLLKLALDPRRWPLEWCDVGALSKFRIGDLACGTGTLLMAAAEAVTDNYLRACGEQRKAPKLDILASLLMQDVLYGYDVLPSALHLTASTLALRAPEVTFRRMRLWSLPLGGPHRRLGSIEFLRDFTIPITLDLFGGSAAPGQVTATGTPSQQFAPLPDLSLCVMNPPFTRSVGGNLLFGSVPEPERNAMQQELATLLRKPRVYANTTAGLGAVFVATADLHLKEGARMALVLPKTLLSGVAWKETRELFRLKYQLEYLIVSHDPNRWNFSENTSLSEVLVVARKLQTSGSAPPKVDENVVCINLWRNPSTAVEALSVAHSIVGGQPGLLASGQGALETTVGPTKVGETVAVPWSELRERNWMLPCSFAQSDLLRAAYHLAKGTFLLPGVATPRAIALCPLGQLGTLGPDARDIHDAFSPATGKTAYSAFWDHNSSQVTTLAQVPNRHLSPLTQPKPGRHLRKVTDLWPKAGPLLLAERLRFNTQRVAAIRLNQRSLSNVWWPVTLNESEEEGSKLLSMWLNSTLGLLLLLIQRGETEGAWMKFKKPLLDAMPVLDIRNLTSSQRQSLVSAYDALCQQPLLPFPQMAQDPTRRAIDDAISGALGLPDLSVLREMLAREPVVCLKPLT